MQREMHAPAIALDKDALAEIAEATLPP